MDKFCVNIGRHFIFNSINCAIALCRRKPKDAAILLTELSECLIYLSSNKTEMVTVSQEIECVESYLNVQKFRFGDRLIIDNEINEQINYMIPPYVLFVIVENMFQHVISKTKEPTHITIGIEIKDDGQYIYIKNCGEGVSKEKFIQLYNSNFIGSLNKRLIANKLEKINAENHIEKCIKFELKLYIQQSNWIGEK